MNLTDTQIRQLRGTDEDVKKAKAEYDAMRAERERLIRVIAESGVSYRKIAYHVSLSYQRVAQIVGVPDDRLTIEQTIEAYCPTCHAKPGEQCTGLDRWGFHDARRDRRMAIHEGELDDVYEGEPAPSGV